VPEYLGKQHPVAHRDLDGLLVVADSHYLAALALLLGGVRDDKPTGRHIVFLEDPNANPAPQRLDCCPSHRRQDPFQS
jgi:hypothetical protein